MRGLRVLDIGNTLASAYCGRLFAAAGADVVLLEHPAGNAVRHIGRWSDDGSTSFFHEYLSAGKRSAVAASIDPLDADAVAWADIVISSCDGDPDSVRARHEHVAAIDPSVVHVVTSGYGLTGPYAGWRSTQLLDWASGGYLYITGDPDREPLQGGGPWASYIAGATAAIGAQAAVMHAIRTGEGQLVDVGAMESVASAHQWSLTMYTHTGADKGRWGARFGESFHPMSLYECGDGRWVCIGAPSREQWENFCITVDAVELLADDSLFAPAVRFERADEIDALAQPWLEQRTAAEAVEELQAARVPASEVLDYAEVLEMEQLREREVFRSRPDLGPDARLLQVPFRLHDGVELAAAPAIGADDDWFRTACASPVSDRRLPSIDLGSLRVVEFSVAWAGPLTGRFLGDLGLDVVKVEHPTGRALGASGTRPDRLDEGWSWGQLAPARIRSEVFPDADPGERPWNRMGVWNKMNRCKRSLCLDAKADGGGEVLARLIGSSDVVFHNYSPRGARSLGIDHDSVLQQNPDIVTVAMTGYGETGPKATHSSYGPILEACGGLDQATGYPDLWPMRVGVALPDAIGGLHGTFAVLAALWERELTGSPVHVDLSQLETMLAFAGESLLWTSVTGVAPAPIGNRSRDHAPQGVYRCLDHSDWVAITVTDDHDWSALCTVLGDALPPALADADPAALREHHDAIDDAISSWTAGRPAVEVAEELQAAGVPACPAFRSGQLVESAHMAERGFMVELDLPDVGPRRFPGTPLHLERTPVELWPAPTLGQHNDDLLADLGYSDHEIAALTAAGALADQPPD